MFFKTYIPKNFCREYVEVKRSSTQLAMFMAVVLGIKPLMDDWIPVDKLEEFKKVCKKYRLKIREDVIFQNVPIENLPSSVSGREYLTTTSAYGHPLNSNKDGQVHLFISRDRKALKKGMWYPVIIKNRVVFQPRIDSLKYGYVLGYPECCIKFFRKYNNWLKYSYLYQAYLNTREQPSFLCNPFLKDTSFSYIYHMPCSYSCKETIKLAGRLREEIKKKEPGYVELTDRFLKLPFLVFYERKFYCFEGELKNGEIKYEDFYFPSPDKSKDIYSKDFEKADRLRLEGRRLILLRNNKIVRKIDVGLSNFAPEYPFIIKFCR